MTLGTNKVIDLLPANNQPLQRYARTVGNLASGAARALGLRCAIREAATTKSVTRRSEPGRAREAACLVWQTDAAARLYEPDDDLAAALQIPLHCLGMVCLHDLLSQRSPAKEDRTGLDALQNAMASGHPFSGLRVALPAEPNGPAVRWWSFSGRPRHDRAQRLLGWQGVVSDVTQARAAEQALLELAHRDKLTGLAKRHQLEERLVRAATAAAGTPTPALVFFDLDHFKIVNDTLGHAAGDALLAAVGARLQAAIGTTGLAVRLGGDEFAAVVDDVARQGGSLALGERLLAVLCRPVAVSGRRVPVSVSIGIALPDAGGCAPTELMARADLALYASKQAGRGCYRTFDPVLQAQRYRRRQLESQLASALAGLQVQLHWQPAVRIHDWQVEHLAARPHWQHPSLGVVSEAELQQLAEQAGLLPLWSDWLLAQACTAAAGLVPSHTVEVRATAAQLRHPDFAPATIRALRATGLAAQRLRIAVRELGFDSHCRATRAAVKALHTAGVQLALDNFSGGPASLLALQNAGFDALYISTELMQALQRVPKPAGALRNLFGMARAFGMRTLATGVDNQHTVSLLQQAGCDALQGSLLGPALSLPVLARRIGDFSAANAEQLPAMQTAVVQQAKQQHRRQAGRLR